MGRFRIIKIGIFFFMFFAAAGMWSKHPCQAEEPQDAATQAGEINLNPVSAAGEPITNAGTSPQVSENQDFARFGIGLGYPYLSFKYRLSNKFSVEAVGSFSKGVEIYGGRVYWNFLHLDKTAVYAGLEGDYAKFDLEGIAGKGYLGTIFVGGEYFLSRAFSVSMDFGPVYSRIREKNDSSLEQKGTDIMLNIGVYFSF